jgi:hypothetical protein
MTRIMKNKEETIKNPLLDSVNEDMARMPMRLSFFEKIGLVSVSIIFIGIAVLSGFSLIIDIFVKLNFLSILIDIFVITICMAAIYFVFNIIRKKIVTELLIDTAFQHGVYNRLQSLIGNIAQAQVGTDVVIDRIDNLDKKVENILKERREEKHDTSVGKEFLQEYISLGTSVKFVVKTIFMIIVTMAMFMFLVNFNLGRITPYASLSIFVLWWLFITNEYYLWKYTVAWTFAFLPIMTIPVVVIIMANLTNYNVLMALLYLSLSFYIVIYYVWAVYATTGSIPFIKPKPDEKSEKIGGFFALQQKGILSEIFEEMKYRFKSSKKEEEKR